jgi:hypothetical protein
MTLTEDPQKLLELQQFYVRQVEQLYQQIQAWGELLDFLKDSLSHVPNLPFSPRWIEAVAESRDNTPSRGVIPSYH